jgi:hypothetical protein
MRHLNDLTEIGSLLGESVSIRKVNGRVVITNRPKRKRPTASPAETAHRRKMSAAANYAKTISGNPELLALYASRVRKKNASAQSVAIGDYMNAPVVQSIDTQRYSGEIGSSIEIDAFDDFQVIKLMVTITSREGVIEEEGEAVYDGERFWVYRTTTANPALTGTKIRAIAYDRPGNKGIGEVIL